MGPRELPLAELERKKGFFLEGMLPTILISVVLLLIVVFAVRSYSKKLKSGCCGAGGDSVKKVRPGDRDISHYPYAKTIHVEGMHCENCARRVENAFNGRDGFYAKVDLSKKTADVYMKNPADTALIADIVRRSGYEVLGVETIEGEK